MSVNAPNFNALLATYLSEVQELEDAIYQAAVVRLIDYAVGKQLEILGAWVGLSRTDPDDEVYRAAVRLQWYRNSSSGTGDELAYIAKQLCGATSVRSLDADRSGHYSLLVAGGTISDAIKAKLQAVSPGGVELIALRRSYPLRPAHCGDHCGQALLVEP